VAQAEASGSAAQAPAKAAQQQRQRGPQVSHYPVSLQRASSLDSVSTHFSGKSHRSQASKAKRGRDADAESLPGVREHADGAADDVSDIASSVSGSMHAHEASSSGRLAAVAASGHLPPLARSRLRPAKQLREGAAGRAQAKPGSPPGGEQAPTRKPLKGRESIAQQNSVKAFKRGMALVSSSKGQLVPAGGIRQYVSPYSQTALRRVSGSRFD
jgi:hypothetical protein